MAKTIKILLVLRSEVDQIVPTSENPRLSQVVPAAAVVANHTFPFIPPPKARKAMAEPPWMPDAASRPRDASHSSSSAPGHRAEPYSTGTWIDDGVDLSVAPHRRPGNPCKAVPMRGSVAAHVSSGVEAPTSAATIQRRTAAARGVGPAPATEARGLSSIAETPHPASTAVPPLLCGL